MRKKKKHATCAADDSERLTLELQSPDESVRAKAVRSLCPCHAGWELFEQHISVVSQLEKDGSPPVRAQVLHVLEDAMKMHSVGDPGYRRQLAEGMVRKKRVSRFRPEEAGLLEKRTGKRRGRSGLILR